MFARVTALVTFEGFLSCVVTLVYFHTFGPSTGVVTLVTVERFFSCVFAFVYFQITSLSARIVAPVTLERLFSSVFEPMSLQTRSMSTGIVTLHIFIGFLACVLSECQLEHKYNHIGHS